MDNQKFRFYKLVNWKYSGHIKFLINLVVVYVSIILKRLYSLFALQEDREPVTEEGERGIFDLLETMRMEHHVDNQKFPFYKLVNGKYVPCENIEEAIQAFENDRRIDYTQINEECCVSTVFLSIDHGFEDKVLLFESLVSGGKWDGRTYRYSSMGQAKRGHWEIVSALQEGREPVTDEGERGIFDLLLETMREGLKEGEEYQTLDEEGEEWKKGKQDED